MGLDLVVEGCAKPGHEPEWLRFVQRSFAEEQLSEQEVARFQDISIPGYERLGAPRVGFDSKADAWILKARKVESTEARAAVLKEFHGYHVLRLVPCDGIPEYSNASAYDGVDETSFRGAFLRDCRDVLDKRLLDDAWNSKLPEAAVSYGRALLDAADAAEGGVRAPKSRTLLQRIGITREHPTIPIAEQISIVRAAGRWFVFWGERGHPIRAWF